MSSNEKITTSVSLADLLVEANSKMMPEGAQVRIGARSSARDLLTQLDDKLVSAETEVRASHALIVKLRTEVETLLKANTYYLELLGVPEPERRAKQDAMRGESMQRLLAGDPEYREQHRRWLFDPQALLTTGGTASGMAAMLQQRQKAMDAITKETAQQIDQRIYDELSKQMYATVMKKSWTPLP